MINWQKLLQNPFTEQFDIQTISPTPIKRQCFVDTEISSTQVPYPKFTHIPWSQVPKQTVDAGKGIQICEWNGPKPMEKMMVLIEQGEKYFICAVDSGDEMILVGNVGCHPIVVVKELVFLNSDGSTFVQFPQKLLKESGDKVLEYIMNTALTFIQNQIH